MHIDAYFLQDIGRPLMGQLEIPDRRLSIETWLSDELWEATQCIWSLPNGNGGLGHQGIVETSNRPPTPLWDGNSSIFEKPFLDGGWVFFCVQTFDNTNWPWFFVFLEVSPASWGYSLFPVMDDHADPWFPSKGATFSHQASRPKTKLMAGQHCSKSWAPNPSTKTWYHLIKNSVITLLLTNIRRNDTKHYKTQWVMEKSWEMTILRGEIEQYGPTQLPVASPKARHLEQDQG